MREVEIAEKLEVETRKLPAEGSINLSLGQSSTRYYVRGEILT